MPPSHPSLTPLNTSISIHADDDSFQFIDVLSHTKRGLFLNSADGSETDLAFLLSATCLWKSEWTKYPFYITFDTRIFQFLLLFSFFINETYWPEPTVHGTNTNLFRFLLKLLQYVCSQILTSFTKTLSNRYLGESDSRNKSHSGTETKKTKTKGMTPSPSPQCCEGKFLLFGVS